MDQSWFSGVPQFDHLKRGTRVQHVFRSSYGPCAANPNSNGRCALLDGMHAMFYAGESLIGVLFETALRDTQPLKGGNVLFPTVKLAGLMLAELELTRDAPLLDLRAPALNRWFLPGSDANRAARSLYASDDHATTHDLVLDLFEELRSRWSTPCMPVLAWPSFQCFGSTVYLAYQPPMQPSWWRVVGTPTPLDDAGVGYSLLQAALAKWRYRWVPLATTYTDQM